MHMQIDYIFFRSIPLCLEQRRQHDMKNKKYSIVYSSLTGNTKVLADAIHEALPQDECEYFGVSDIAVK